MKLIYKETYAVLPCDFSGEPISDASFSPKQFATE